jgi:hypothetical protein
MHVYDAVMRDHAWFMQQRLAGRWWSSSTCVRMGSVLPETSCQARSSHHHMEEEVNLRPGEGGWLLCCT